MEYSDKYGTSRYEHHPFQSEKCDFVHNIFKMSPMAINVIKCCHRSNMFQEKGILHIITLW